MQFAAVPGRLWIRERPAGFLPQAGEPIAARARTHRPLSRHRRPARLGHDVKPQNTGRERLRPSPIRHALVQSPVLGRLRRRIVPRHWSQSAQGVLASSDRAARICRRDLIARLREVFDADLAQLGSWLGITLDCENFDDGDHRAMPTTGQSADAARHRLAPRTLPASWHGGLAQVKTVTISGRMSFSPAANPFRIRAATRLVERRIVRRRGRDRAVAFRGSNSSVSSANGSTP